MNRVRLILDTDIGTDVDDALALVAAAKSPEIELSAVTTVLGDVELRARIARKLLVLLNRPEIPVAAGARLPLLRRHEPAMMGHEGGGLLEPGERVDGICAQHGVEGIVAMAGMDGPIALCCIGAVTNVALAFILQPDLLRKVDPLVIMGGAMRPPSLGTTVLPSFFETNLNNDPEAAEIVLRSGMPIKLVPADITFNACLQNKGLERIRSRGTPLHRALADMCDEWHKCLVEIFGTFDLDVHALDDVSVLLHDPLALAALVQPDLISFEPMRISLHRNREGRLETVRDECGGVEIEVAVDADYAGLEEWLVERIVA